MITKEQFLRDTTEDEVIRVIRDFIDIHNNMAMEDEYTTMDEISVMEKNLVTISRTIIKQELEVREDGH